MPMSARKRKLLIFDDNKNILTALTRLLEMEVDEVHTASNPNLIPGMVRAHDYDAIFLDMNFSASVQSGNEGLFWMKEILKMDPNAVEYPRLELSGIKKCLSSLEILQTDILLRINLS